jgi:uncharacterized protein YlxW (UPF0749 family)
MNAADELIYNNDLQLLGYILGEMADVVMMLEENQEMIKLLMALNDFYAIHKTRTNDLLKLQRSVNDARLKHRKVVAERNQYKKELEDVSKRLQQIMDRQLNRG